MARRDADDGAVGWPSRGDIPGLGEQADDPRSSAVSHARAHAGLVTQAIGTEQLKPLFSSVSHGPVRHETSLPFWLSRMIDSAHRNRLVTVGLVKAPVSSPWYGARIPALLQAPVRWLGESARTHPGPLF